MGDRGGEGGRIGDGWRGRSEEYRKGEGGREGDECVVKGLR